MPLIQEIITELTLTSIDCNYSFTVVAEPPTDVQAISYDPFSMNLTWTPPKDYDKIVNVSGYYIFYREYDSAPGTWDVAGVPGLNTTSFLLRDLKPFTKYRLRMTLAVRHGNGPASGEIMNSTIEGGKIPYHRVPHEGSNPDYKHSSW